MQPCSTPKGSCSASQNLRFSIRLSQVHPRDGAWLVGGPAPCVSSGGKCPLPSGDGPVPTGRRSDRLGHVPGLPPGPFVALARCRSLHCCFPPGETGQGRGTEGPRRTGETAAWPPVQESGGDAPRRSAVSETLHPEGGVEGSAGVWGGAAWPCPACAHRLSSDGSTFCVTEGLSRHVLPRRFGWCLEMTGATEEGSVARRCRAGPGPGHTGGGCSLALRPFARVT